MDIVDSQIHLFLTLETDAAIAAMDALGIQAALIDEFWGYDEKGDPRPGYTVPGGIFRPTAPGGERASMLHPDRFAYLLRIHHKDPELKGLAGLAKAAPHALALRADVRAKADVDDLANGAFRPFFAAAADNNLPVFMLTLGQASLLRPYIQEFKDLTFIIDHCGLPPEPAQFGEVLKLSAYQNVAMKWCHAPFVFAASGYPFGDLMPFLRQALDAFGPQRLMWASDFTAIQTGESWAESLFYVRDAPILSATDKEWILGRTARTLLNWPPPSVAAAPVRHPH
jgi:L-fuconolactonase